MLNRRKSVLEKEKQRPMLKQQKRNIDDPRIINSLKEKLDDLFKRWLSQARNEADYDGNGEDEKEYFFHIDSRAITKFYNELGNYRKYILENYPYQVWKKDQWYPRK